MKYLKEFAIILSITFAGEMLNLFLPFPVPSSIYGLLLMLILLCSGILKAEQVESAADFLIEMMPVMFIPAGVGLIVSWSSLRPVVIPVMVITIVTTILVMAGTGKMADFLLYIENLKDKKGKKR